MDNLASGLLGALIGSLLTMLYELWAHKMRLRAEITIAVLGWIEGV